MFLINAVTLYWYQREKRPSEPDGENAPPASHLQSQTQCMCIYQCETTEVGPTNTERSFLCSPFFFLLLLNNEAWLMLSAMLLAIAVAERLGLWEAAGGSCCWTTQQRKFTQAPTHNTCWWRQTELRLFFCFLFFHLGDFNPVSGGLYLSYFLNLTSVSSVTFTFRSFRSLHEYINYLAVNLYMSSIFLATV